jgi:hypothetical protein
MPFKYQGFTSATDPPPAADAKNRDPTINVVPVPPLAIDTGALIPSALPVKARPLPAA